MDAGPSFRLPRKARPRRYELQIRPELTTARFDGRVVITVEVAEATRTLVLNAIELDIRGVTLSTPAGASLVPELCFNEEDQQVALNFSEQLEPSEGYQLTMEFAGVLNDQLRGFYRSTFRDQNGAEHVIATTQFEASDARRAFPCWDEPDLKASFQTTLVVEPGLTGLSNGRLESERILDDGWVEMRFAETMVMSTYLVAFVVGPYELTDPIEVDGVPVRLATVPGKLGLTPFGMEVAVHALRFLRDYFGIAYPSDKIDHIAVPDFAAGAMENLGCVTYRESVLLTERERAAQTELQRIASVVSHETAHMWFGDLVTMKWWNGIWLNEAFATFMELTTTEAYRPEWQVWTTFGAGKSAAMTIDGLRATRPVEFEVGRPEEAEAMFDVLTYQKGGSVLRMLEQFIGPEVFRKGISQYLTTHAYSNTETVDLWNAIEAVSGQPVQAIMSSWIHQGGYPMISAELGSDAATVVLRQNRFVYDGEESPETWVVPVNLRASVDGTVHHERLLLDQREGSYTFTGPVDWVVVNDGAWGFYRSRYSKELWRRLKSAGPVSILAPLERLALVVDLWAAVTAGQAELAEWVEVTTCVATDPDPDVWAAVGSVLTLLDLIADEADGQALRSFVTRLGLPVWDQLTWTPAPGESERTAVARARVLLPLAQIGQDQELISEAVRRFARHRTDEAEPAGLGPDLVGVAARISVASGTEQAWEEMLERYRATEIPQEQLRYLYALTETPYRDLSQRTLDLAISPEVRSQDAPFVIAQVLSRRGAAASAWSWVQGHWDEIVAHMPPSLWMRILEAATVLTDGELAASVRHFCASRDLPVSPIRIEQILERMDITVALATRLRGRIGPTLPA
ncbi:MAG: M1 family metallopeptidase [Acidimicrobiales bacterium]|nr:M1 family metallopeptidase [Acidimicrobiales bacterium]